MQSKPILLGLLLLGSSLIGDISFTYGGGGCGSNTFTPPGNNYGQVPCGDFIFTKTTDANCPTNNIPPAAFQDRFGSFAGRVLFVCGNTGGGQEMHFHMNTAGQFTTIAYDTSCFNIVTGSESQRIEITDQAETGYLLAWDLAVAGNPATACTATRATVGGQSCSAGSTSIYSTPFGGTGATNTESSIFNVNITISWDTSTYSVAVNGVSTVTGVAFCETPVTNVGQLIIRRVIANTGGMSLDNLIMTGSGDPPTAPAGLSGTITQIQGTSGSNTELRWPVSSNDPDQVQGDYQYRIYLNGAFVGTDGTTALDADGTRFDIINYIASPNVAANLVFQVSALNLTTGIEGPKSCAITVNDGVLGDFDDCGDATGLGGDNGTGHTTPTDAAAGLKGFCSDLMGDSSGSLFLCGLILAAIVFLSVVAAFGAFSGSMSMPALIGGLVFALGEAIFNVIAGIWSLGAAALMAILSAGIVLFFLRKMFFARASGGGEEDG